MRFFGICIGFYGRELSFLDLDGFAIYDWIGRKMGGQGYFVFSRDGMFFLMVFLYGRK